MSETKEPWEVEQNERKKTMKMNEIANNPLEKRNKEHYKNLKVAKTWIKSLMDKIEFETTPVKTRWEGKNSGSTPVEHGRNRTWTWEDERILDEINNTLPPELMQEWHKGKKDFRPHSGWGRRKKLDKMRELEWKHDTPVKWISKKRTRSSQFEMMSEESNITMSSEERIEDKSLE